jgi:cytochrome c oxidase subunit II
LRKHPLAQMLLIGAVASLIGIALALAIDWFPTVASTQAKDVDSLYDVLLIASVPVFVLTQTIVLFSVWKFRMRPGEELKDGPPIHGNTALEVIWTAIPAIMMLSLSVYAYVVLRDVEQAQANTMRVDVTASQFYWRFTYRDGGQSPVVSEELYLPKGRPVQFRIQSTDVIHDFWVPNFSIKMDAVPGSVTKYRITPSREGSYPVVCAELCGLGHSTMRAPARVVSQQAFDNWLSQKRARARPSQAPGS